jgi:hypothetical protein
MPAPDNDPKPRPPRRPYVAPAIEETSDFETLALDCTQSVGACSIDPTEPEQQPSSA